MMLKQKEISCKFYSIKLRKKNIILRVSSSTRSLEGNTFFSMTGLNGGLGGGLICGFVD